MPSIKSPDQSLASTILVVDDRVENLKLMSDFLMDAGFEVLVAKSGKRAIGILEQKLPEIVLLDVMMPEMNGFEVCQHLKSWEKTQDIPIIFMSALDDFSNPEEKIKGLKLGAVDYISKPIQLEEVLTRVQLHLKLSALTKELQDNNKKLEKEIEEREQREAELRRTQAQLVDNATLENLGRLVSGFAHEINNPIGILYGNVSYAHQYFHDLAGLLNLYQQAYPSPLPEITKFSQEIDLAFLQEDWSQLMRSMEGNVDRIRHMVNTLKNFTRLEESYLKPVDLNESIDNMLLMLQHRLRSAVGRPEIKVIKDYKLIPKVSGYASQLNQVWMCLLNNAIDSLELSYANDGTEQDLEEPPTITICTKIEPSAPSQDSETAIVKITHNGVGTKDDLCQKLFDPFSTLKPSGGSASLGLFLSRRIIEEQHHGNIHFLSVAARRTELTVEIPVKQ
jgi:signal transduction histidine kinase